MQRLDAPVLLVGSIPGEDAREAMGLCADGLGDYIGALPDGETGFRRIWIVYLAVKTYDPHPDLDTVQKPREGWIPADYRDPWLFRVRPGCQRLRFDHLGYAEEARASYEVFRALRDEGRIPGNVRFQVSLPATESGFRMFSAVPEDFDVFWEGYEEAIGREIQSLLEAIPAEDLLLQWDICIEVLAIEVGDGARGGFPWKAPGDPFDRYVRAMRTLATLVPEEVPMGCHLCYGDLGHEHLVEPADLGLMVRMANATVETASRRVDFFHFPVPRGRDDAPYFEPLRDLAIGEAKFYLGLVHQSDGLEGTLGRIRQAKRFAPEFGIATECGFGRRPLESIPELLKIHREAAGQL